MKLDITKEFSTRTDRVKGIDLHPTEPWVLTTLYSGKVEIWSYETNTKIKTIDVTDVPVRAGRFIARKNWIVVGSDDFKIRVYNYNTSEKITQFEAHPDYIRSIAVHLSKPYILTGSDDMTVKLWNWDKNWKLEQIFEGHQHYVMSVAFNPKDLNTFASASLDRSVKIWSLGQPVPNFTLDAHEAKGVNYLDYYPQSDKPYLITSSDDRTIKIWDYQTKACIATLEGHLSNVSFAVFHPELPLIISGSEDSTIKIWNSNTYKLEKSLNYGLERAWCVTTKKGSNLVGVGFDSGNVILKLGNEEPALSMDPVGKIIWAKNSEVFTTVIKTSNVDSISDGEILPLPQKELGTTEMFPTSLKHSPNGRFVAVTGDGEYIIYTSLAWRNKSYGDALDFVWAQDSNEYAIRDELQSIKIFKNFRENPSSTPNFVYSADKIFGGTLLGVKSVEGGFVSFFDWETGKLIRRIDVDPIDVVWSDSGELVIIICSDASYVLKYNKDVFLQAASNNDIDPEEGVEASFDVLHDLSESITSGKWVGDVFIFTTSTNRLNYLVGGKTFNISHFDKNMYLLGYLPRDNKIYVADKDINVSSYRLSLTILEYQTIVLRGNLEDAMSLYYENELSLTSNEKSKISSFLESQGYIEEALEISTDNEQKFQLSLKMKDFKQAYTIATEENNESKWRTLGDLSLKSFNYKLAIDCYEKAKDLESLFLIFSSFNNLNKLRELGIEAEESRKFNLAFNCYWLTGEREKIVDLLAHSERLSECAIFGLTYGVKNIQLGEIVNKWKTDLTKNGKKNIADRLCDPTVDTEIFPSDEPEDEPVSEKDTVKPASPVLLDGSSKKSD
ncbi:coatomer subunit beta' [Ascoidea rubescens DSM 1968]|uniref:Coatomer subunit beta' n=1 Tax=Ascoidea rubescens DSM 1968 TaxID=1344418 RepID=A0A1D2VPR4_9ASCO|nr:essential beta'-coat protein of the COPI coatomer [Ascoidea rubescens DSM 1968]ODV63613.1 essential beta'-coat protein of the COPI coatomer [Ascoidea rubescens DSM 1968]